MSTRSIFAFAAQPLFRQCRPASLPRAARPFDLARFSAANVHARFASNNQFTPRVIAIAKTSSQASSLLWSAKVAGIASLALGLSAWNQPRIECQGSVTSNLYISHFDPASIASPAAAPPSYSSAGNTFPPPPESAVNLYELSFGTVCGVCAGVFVKKGAKALAFVLGGVFVLLQVSRACSMSCFTAEPFNTAVFWLIIRHSS